jgi:hypothetical protein
MSSVPYLKALCPSMYPSAKTYTEYQTAKVIAKHLHLGDSNYRAMFHALPHGMRNLATHLWFEEFRYRGGEPWTT